MNAIVKAERTPDKRRGQLISDTPKKTSSKRLCRLSFYRIPPKTEADLDHLEEYAIARLQVLRRIDVLRAQGVTGDKFTSEIVEADTKYLYPLAGSAIQNQLRDLISHFVLRMAYCKTEELRRWLLTNECQLFSIRLANARPSELKIFLENNGITYPPISKTEKVKFRSQLMAAEGSNFSANQFDALQFYKVPFTEVVNLVARRKVFLCGGYAYVSADRVSAIACERFRTNLSYSLCLVSKSPILHKDDRIAPLVRNLSHVAYRFGGSLNGGGTSSSESAINSEIVVGVFKNYLTTVLGHSDPKIKPAGVSKMFINVGTRKPNERDRTCPIAGRLHKSNTQKYTVFFDTQVMMQGCWDADCIAKNKHVFYQIHEGQCQRVGWDPPPVLTMETSMKK